MLYSASEYETTLLQCACLFISAFFRLNKGFFMYNGCGPASASLKLRLNCYFIIFSSHGGHNSIETSYETYDFNSTFVPN